MEIQKIFSEDNGEERLYSVLLDDTEIKLFSEFQKEFNSKAAKKRNNKYFEALGTEDTRGKKTGRVSYNDNFGGTVNFKVGPSSQELNREDGQLIRQRKINGQFDSSYRKSIKEMESAFKEYQRKEDIDSWNKFIEASEKPNKHFDAMRDRGNISSRVKVAKEAGNKMDTKVTSEEISKRRGRDLVREISSEDAKKTYENNRDKLPGKKTSATDPLTKPLKDRMTPEKKEIIQNKLKRKAEKAAERAAQSQASIAKHAEKAKSLRKLRNIKRGAAGVAIGAGTLGVGYGIKKAMEKNNEN